MPRIPILTTLLRTRRYSTKQSIQKWIETITQAPGSTHEDIIDPLRASHLLRTLPTRQHLPLSSLSVKIGDELGQGQHMIYFQPETALRDLGLDGSSPEYNAPPPYTRRMWAGGSISWPNPNPSSLPGPDRGLRIGRQVIEKRNIDKVEYKEAKDMIFIHQQRKIWDIDLAGNDDMWGVKEVRIHVFRPPSSPASTSSNVMSTATTTSNSNAAAHTNADPPPDISFTYTPSTPLLFRYSALTFNAHKIHYDHPHSTSVEQQEGPLVHGPLTATLLIELAVTAGKEKGKSLVDFEYRAVSPIVVDREVQLVGRWTDRALEMAARQGGGVGMKATARYA